MAEPMRIRATTRDGVVNVKVLMRHEMETGLRKDAAGNLVSAHFIQSVSATWRGKVVLSAQWGPAVSKNPFIEFNFRGGKAGEKISITWTDNRGDTRADEAVIN